MPESPHLWVLTIGNVRTGKASKQLSSPQMHLLCGRLHGKDWLNRMRAEEGEMGVAACGGSLQEAAQP